VVKFTTEKGRLKDFVQMKPGFQKETLFGEFLYFCTIRVYVIYENSLLIFFKHLYPDIDFDALPGPGG
jgi:hypothetical protein